MKISPNHIGGTYTILKTYISISQRNTNSCVSMYLPVESMFRQFRQRIMDLVGIDHSIDL